MTEQGAAVTTEQLEAIVSILDLMTGHAVRMAEAANTGTLAMRNLLVARGALSEEEFNEAVDKVEAEQKMLFALDPDVQDALGQIRSILRGAHP